ncbi:hypothetical protein CYY_003254 [Polysphondylium violaceum]|uniref:Cytochrome P450 family protein n=1 Tax=Polysphondylium violaceum TaxID=133409 RepID=A0A8J4PXY3_9MYCE|nr:hypothetical protein CYY_003254 [Polysphondylium violaceum]
MLQTIILLIFLYIFFDFIKKNKRFSKNDPPGPISLPFIGDLGRLSKSPPHKALFELSKTYGKIFRIWLGDNYTIVISDPQLIREIFVKNFESFTNRLHTYPTRFVSNNFRNLNSGDYEYWTKNRQMVSHAFTNVKLRSFASVIEEESLDLIETMKEFERQQIPFSPKNYTKKYSMNIILQYIFSDKLKVQDGETENNKIFTLAKEIDKLFLYVGTFRMEKYINVIGWVSYMLKKYIFTSFKENLDKTVNDIVDEHIKTIDRENPRDLLDSIIMQCDLNDKFEKQLPAMIGADLLLAGTETSASSIEYFIMIMANNPLVQQKAFEELNQVIGKGNQVKLSHHKSTPYLNAVIKEASRIKTTAPLGLPRTANQDIMIGDYFIPKGTQILMNIYALANDECYWDQPNVFDPTRFLNNNHSDRYIPFGVGPRNCVGSNLANDEIYIACANILLNFEITSVDGKKIDETEVLDLTVHPKYDFSVLINSR